MLFLTELKFHFIFVSTNMSRRWHSNEPVTAANAKLFLFDHL
jgi:hypothetical protein